MSPVLARRQERAFERLYRKHVGDVYRYALAVLSDPLDTEVTHARQALREELEGSLACHHAELAISRRLDDRLARKEKRRLRAHLRACEECHAFARSQQRQRAALRALAAVPLPDTLLRFRPAEAGAGLEQEQIGRKFSRARASP